MSAPIRGRRCSRRSPRQCRGARARGAGARGAGARDASAGGRGGFVDRHRRRCVPRRTAARRPCRASGDPGADLDPRRQSAARAERCARGGASAGGRRPGRPRSALGGDVPPVPGASPAERGAMTHVTHSRTLERLPRAASRAFRTTTMPTRRPLRRALIRALPLVLAACASQEPAPDAKAPAMRTAPLKTTQGVSPALADAAERAMQPGLPTRRTRHVSSKAPAYS